MESTFNWPYEPEKTKLKIDGYGIIYKATLLSTEEVYIGKTYQTLHRRIICHYSNAFNSKTDEFDSHFGRVIRKYGKESFKWEILYENIPINSLPQLEKDTIAKFDSFHHGLNSTEGGEGSFGFKHSEESKKKMSEIHKGQFVSDETREKLSKMRKGKKHSDEWNENIRLSQIGLKAGDKHPNFGKHLSQETKDKIGKSNSEKFIGKIHPLAGRERTDETKNKISIANKGRKPSQKTIDAVKLANTGRTLPDETKKKISIANSGRIFSEQTRQNMSLARLGKSVSEETKNKLREINSKNSPRFIVLKDGNIVGSWKNPNQCASDLGLSRTSVRRYLSGECAGENFRGYVFKYEEEEKICH